MSHRRFRVGNLKVGEFKEVEEQAGKVYRRMSEPANLSRGQAGGCPLGPILRYATHVCKAAACRR